MNELTLDRLKELMLRCSGGDDSVDLSGDIAERPFRDLGYDSLAVLELASQLQREYGLEIPDEAIEEMSSPAAVLGYVNRQLSVA